MRTSHRRCGQDLNKHVTRIYGVDQITSRKPKTDECVWEKRWEVKRIRFRKMMRYLSFEVEKQKKKQPPPPKQQQ